MAPDAAVPSLPSSGWRVRVQLGESVGRVGECCPSGSWDEHRMTEGFGL